MKTFALIAIGVSALSVAACVRPSTHKEPLKPLARLDCPDEQGSFRRAAVAADGRSCDYVGSDGSKVQLKLISFTGDADAVLAPIESQMKTMLPAPPAVPASNPPTPPAPTPGRSKDDVNIDLPGISIHADNENAKVHVGGVNIDAKGDSAHITGGGKGRGQFTVDANDNGAVVRARSFGGPNLEESWIWASKTPGPEGWRSVGYDAVGPKSGPLVVASFQSRSDQHDNLFEDVKSLARKTAKG